MQIQAVSTANAYASSRSGSRPNRGAITFTDPTGELTEVRMEGRRFANGIMVSLGLEAAVAASVYGIWQAVHILLR